MSGENDHQQAKIQAINYTIILKHYIYIYSSENTVCGTMNPCASYYQETVQVLPF